MREVSLDDLRARLAASGAIVPDIHSDSLTEWPADRSPEVIGRRLVDRFLERTPDEWSARWYPWTKDAAMHYAIPCAWYGAFLYAEATEDGALSARLAKLYTDSYLPDGPRACCVPEPVHVDLTMFGCLPLAAFFRTGNAAARAQGLAMADAQWAEPRKGAPAFNGMADADGQLAWWRAGYTPQTRLRARRPGTCLSLFVQPRNDASLGHRPQRASARHLRIRNRLDRELLLSPAVLRAGNGVPFHSHQL